MQSCVTGCREVSYDTSSMMLSLVSAGGDPIRVDVGSLLREASDKRSILLIKKKKNTNSRFFIFQKTFAPVSRPVQVKDKKGKEELLDPLETLRPPPVMVEEDDN